MYVSTANSAGSLIATIPILGYGQIQLARLNAAFLLTRFQLPIPLNWNPRGFGFLEFDSVAPVNVTQCREFSSIKHEALRRARFGLNQ